MRWDCPARCPSPRLPDRAGLDRRDVVETSSRGGPRRQGEVVHPHLARRRPEPPGDVRPEAGGPVGSPRAVRQHRDGAAGDQGLGAHARDRVPARSDGGPSRDDLAAGRAQPRQSLPADRLPADPGDRLPRVRRGGFTAPGKRRGLADSCGRAGCGVLRRSRVFTRSFRSVRGGGRSGEARVPGP